MVKKHFKKWLQKWVLVSRLKPTVPAVPGNKLTAEDICKAVIIAADIVEMDRFDGKPQNRPLQTVSRKLKN